MRAAAASSINGLLEAIARTCGSARAAKRDDSVSGRVEPGTSYAEGRYCPQGNDCRLSGNG